MLCKNCKGTGNIASADGMRVSHLCPDCSGNGFTGYDQMKSVGLCPECGHHGFDCTCPRVGGTNQGCGGGIHALVDKLQADIEILRREREAIKDCLKITDVVSALAAIEQIVYTGISK